jgi:phosphate transport system protein
MLSKYEEALQELANEVHGFGKLNEEAFEKVYEALKTNNPSKANEARKLLKNNHKTNARIDMNAITTLALYAPEARDLRRVITQIKIASELSRIGDYIRTHAKNVLSELAMDEEKEMREMDKTQDAFYQSTLSALRLALDMILEQDSESLDNLARKISVEESKCDDFVSILEKNMITKICTLPDQAEDLVDHLHVIRKLERISDRCINIAKLTRYAVEGGKLKL